MRRLLGLALIVLLVACAGEANDQTLVVVATTSIIGDIVGEVTGERAVVEVVMPNGVDPHGFQPSASQIATLARADLVVANGLGLEQGLQDALAAAIEDGARVIELAPLVDPIPFDAGGDEDAPSPGDEGAQALDPHFWLDPIRVADAARLVADELTAIQPDVDWSASAEAYGHSLAAADETIVSVLSSVDDRRLVTNHASLGYFANRYEFEVVATVIPGGTTLGQPSSAQLAELVALLDSEGLRAIFADTSSPDLLARAIAAELGDEVAVVNLYTESLGDGDALTVVGMLMTNAELIAAALGGPG